ncbi:MULTISPECIES: tyrosine-type recombinase/integrase [Ureibacillus]|uniref:tyrosine-type recombinase/integrase n=1 Tax=Ureibacillus TaxID=160795 RepID=UPI0002F17D3C|nr:tyrosine-type recombinase/integrase [Ureibacillus thermosphaericus]
MARRKNLSVNELAILNDIVAVNYTLDELVQKFIEDCELRNLRSHTIKFYRSELSTFQSLLNEQELELSPSDITGNIIKQNVILYMKGKGIKPVSINTRLRALRAFFNYLHKQKFIRNNPMSDIQLLKDRKHVIETFDIKQISQMLKACDVRTFVGFRDYTIIMLLLETGIRANELIGIQVTDIIWHDKVIRIRNAKGQYERFVPIQKKMIEQLKKYVAIRGTVDTEYLFITQDETPMSKRQLQNRIAIIGKKANIKNVRCSPHTFRHTFAKLSVMNGANAFQLQAILGHTTLEMTKVYVNLFSNEISESHAKFSPLNNLK